MEMKEFLAGRKSVRKYERNHTISDAEIEAILTYAAKAPSSNNFQPWKVFVVRSNEKKTQIKDLAYGQQQVEDASALFLIFGDKKAYNIDEMIQYNLKNGILQQENVAKQRKQLEMFFATNPMDRENEGVKLDTGLFAMHLMHVVRAFGYESVPIRGVDFKAVMNYLGISEDLVPVLLLPVGKPAAEGYPHIRKDVASFATIID